MWLRVEQAAFISRPLELLRRLRGVSLATRLRLRQRLLQHRADVIYEAEGSRVATHFLRRRGRCSEGEGRGARPYP